ncbi:MAG: hypothetical protein JWO09_2198 [Bacteroidetes bacterium]|nr:hypothetical protein [Bacteroidota bacterium]
MKNPITIKLITALLFLFFTQQSAGQSAPTKKGVFDIPHKTPHELWMWPHRATVFTIIKERKKAYDTTYIKSYSKRFIITMPITTRLMHFDLVDWKAGKRLQYTPNYRYDICIGISSRWATFIANTGLTIYNRNNKSRGVTRYNDIQLNLYGKRVTSDISYQYYRGFYIANTHDYTHEDNHKFEVRPDVKTTLFSTSTYYVFNYKKFSYRSTFAFTESQLKSAGSPLLGAYYTLFGVRSDSSLVSSIFIGSFDSLSRVWKGSSQTFGINAGYIYTYVKKKFYATTSVVPGFGLEQTTYERTDASRFRSSYGPSAKVNLRLGFGYDTGNFYYGTMGMYDFFFNFSKVNCTFNYSTGKAMVFVGYRFKALKTERRVLRKLGMIDYPGDPRNAK